MARTNVSGGVVPMATEYLGAGHEALAQGAWEEACAAFESALEIEVTAEGLEGLSWAAWWLNDADVTFSAREQAYHLYRQTDDHYGAARMAIWLASDYVDFRGELAVANGWRQRARRLLDGLDPTVEHGWLVLTEGAVAIEEGDTASARRLGREAQDLGRHLNAFDIKMLGLALEGIALVSEGNVAQGMRYLDESAAAAAAGELQEIVSATWAFCFLIRACDQAHDHDRAEQWCRRMKAFAKRLQIRFVLGVCRVHYASVLMNRGSWREAEDELMEATEDLIASRPAGAGEGIVRLAELRRRQGRFEEAVELFAQVEGHPLALVGRAELALAQGQPAQAVALLEQFLRHVPPENKTKQATALEPLVRAQVALGNYAQAAETLQRLRSISNTIETLPLQAATAFANGVVAVAKGKYETARRRFEDAAYLFERGKASFEASRARLELATVLMGLGQFETAERQARRAKESLQQVGAAQETKRAEALLRQLARQRAVDNDKPNGSIPLTRREQQVLRLVAQGLTDKEIAVKLTISEHTVHRHIANIRTKLNCPSRTAAVAYATQHGLL